MAKPMIFLVDDDANDEELARIALEGTSVPHELVVARDGVHALDWLLSPTPAADAGSQPLPHLVLLDLKLPRVSGLEVLQQLRDDPRTRLVPVVVFTSSTEDRDLEEAYNRGANAYVRKPVDYREYRALIVDLAAFWLRHNHPPGAAPGAGPGAIGAPS
jgi:two-component system response regulator